MRNRTPRTLRPRNVILDLLSRRCAGKSDADKSIVSRNCHMRDPAARGKCAANDVGNRAQFGGAARHSRNVVNALNGNVIALWLFGPSGMRESYPGVMPGRSPICPRRAANLRDGGVRHPVDLPEGYHTAPRAQAWQERRRLARSLGPGCRAVGLRQVDGMPHESRRGKGGGVGWVAERPRLLYPFNWAANDHESPGAGGNLLDHRPWSRRTTGNIEHRPK